MNRVDRRILGAVRMLDRALGPVGIGAPLELVPDDSRWVRNRSGDFVLLRAPSLDAHRLAFAVPPAAPAPHSVTVSATVRDPSGSYLPRRFSIAVPRPVGDGPDGLFTPVPIHLPPSPAFRLRSTWAVVRVSVRLEPDADHPEGTPVEGAVLRLESDDLGLRCMSLTDRRGEGLLVGHGIPLMSPGDDEVVNSAVEHDVTVVVELSETDADTGLRSSIPDPDDLWSRRGALLTDDQTVDLASGDDRAIQFTLPRS